MSGGCGVYVVSSWLLEIGMVARSRVDAVLDADPGDDVVLLVGGLVDALEADGDGDFGAFVEGAGEAEGSAELAGALFHDGDAEVADAAGGGVGGEAVAVVGDGEREGLGVEVEADADGGAGGVEDGVGDGLLTDADEVVDGDGGEGDLFAFDVEGGFDGVAEAVAPMARERAWERMLVSSSDSRRSQMMRRASAWQWATMLRARAQDSAAGVAVASASRKRLDVASSCQEMAANPAMRVSWQSEAMRLRSSMTMPIWPFRSWSRWRRSWTARAMRPRARRRSKYQVW